MQKVRHQSEVEGVNVKKVSQLQARNFSRNSLQNISSNKIPFIDT
jgi:hypothetical protein